MQVCIDVMFSLLVDESCNFFFIFLDIQYFLKAKNE